MTSTHQRTIRDIRMEDGMSNTGQGLQMPVLSDTAYKAAVLTKRHDVCKKIGKYLKNHTAD